MRWLVVALASVGAGFWAACAIMSRLHYADDQAYGLWLESNRGEVYNSR